MTHDLLSELLELVRARCSLSGRLIAGGAWGRRFANLDAVKFCAAVDGGCWYVMEGMSAPARFESGDVLVMNGTRALRLGAEPELAMTPPPTPLARDADGTYRLGEGADFSMVSGLVEVDARHRPLLVAGLPALLRVDGGAPEASSLRWLLDQIVMNVSPLACLTRWRMHLAGRDLRAGASVAAVAGAVGYQSESAFNHAFRREMGTTPARFRRPSGAGAESVDAIAVHAL